VPVNQVVEAGHENIVRLLISHGAVVNQTIPQMKLLSLFQLKWQYKNFSIPIESQSKSYFEAKLLLQVRLKKRHKEIAKLLIRSRANVIFGL
jgi:hypothetical protein